MLDTSRHCSVETETRRDGTKTESPLLPSRRGRNIRRAEPRSLLIHSHFLILKLGVMEKRLSVCRRTLGASLAHSTRARSAERNVPEPDSSHGVPPPLKRSESDCIESPGGDEELDDIVHQLSDGLDIDCKAIPTLPRYPAALSTKNTSCWSEPDAGRFKVRGANYLQQTTKRKEKVPSGPYLFKALGADVLLTNKNSGPGTEVCTNYSTSILGGRARATSTFIINFVCPWGIIINYYEIPDLYLRYLRTTDSTRAEDEASLSTLKPHERATARFFLGSDDYRDSTLKLIPHAVEGPLVVRKMVAGTPAIIGRRLPSKYTYIPASNGLADCFEVDLDVNETDKVSCCSHVIHANANVGLLCRWVKPHAT